MLFTHRSISKVVASISFGSALLLAITGIATAKTRRPAALDDDQVHSDIHGAIDVNHRSATENDYRASGQTAEDVFSNFSALRDDAIWTEACTVLRNLPGEELALYDGLIRDSRYASIPCQKILFQKLQTYWQDSDRLLQIHVEQKRLQSRLSYAKLDENTDRIPAAKADSSDERSLATLKKGEVALVFQGGPYPGRTERILETLKHHGIHANFLLSGKNCRAHPELAKKIATQHEALGSCAMNRKALDRLPIKNAEDQMLEGQDAVRTAAGLESSVFGFPLAASSPDLIDFAQQKKWTILVSKLGFTVGHDFMIVDSRDWQLTDPSALYDHVFASLERGNRGPASETREGGQILLFHDEFEATALALPAIIDEILSRGLKPVIVK